ncbi:histone-lysine N-methyltransferase SETMAR [Elysia marginata]|uniref:Histone-lysine N-methyltransferase SETMAR n=1 Tax=Elysia marginata TaxID=1093978 RepID=A0AAV4F8K2_9GAST|nr:histone-lysine N-methyltransferase SETMAR [Elysia marginata]
MQSMQYRHKNSPAPKKFKVVASARKVLLTMFWDMEGIVHIEFLEQGKTINLERYVSTLRALKGRLRRVRQDKVKDVVIQHDNARPHTSRQTQCALQQLELPTIPHPPYSSDLAPSDFFLFPLLKKHLKGNHYETDAEVEADVRSWCRSQTPEFFADGMRKLVQRWRLCIERDAAGLPGGQGFASLPYELKIRILSSLDAVTLCHVIQTDSDLGSLAKEKVIWRRIYIRDFGKPENSDLRRDWYEHTPAETMTLCEN